MNRNSLNVRIQEILHKALIADDLALSAWVGGSTATGFEDSLSDFDIVIISENPEHIFRALETVLQKEFGIEKVWNVEESPWKGFHQKFYILSNTPESYYVDAGVFINMDPKDYEEQFNKARHGQPVILFDKKNILDAASKKPKLVNPPNLNKTNYYARFEIMYRTFLKESLRGKYIDSFAFYQRLVQMLVQVLRMEQSPQKYDFGLRYLYRDLKTEDAQFIETALKANDITSLQTQAKLIRDRMKTLIAK